MSQPETGLENFLRSHVIFMGADADLNEDLLRKLTGAVADSLVQGEQAESDTETIEPDDEGRR